VTRPPGLQATKDQWQTVVFASQSATLSFPAAAASQLLMESRSASSTSPGAPGAPAHQRMRAPQRLH